MLTRWRERTNAPVPTVRNPEYDAEFEKEQIERLTSRKINHHNKDVDEFREMLTNMSERTQ